MEISAGDDTVSLPVPAFPLDVAVTVAFPTAFVVAVPAELTFRIPAGELVQLAVFVRSAILPSV
jgi:hypothetical protein